MIVRFWGTRGSIPKPGPGTVRYGGNTSCVEVRSASGTLVVLDCGTGAHGLGQALVGSAPSPPRGHLLIGHTHWDHIQGFPFFAPVFIPGNEWHIYGPRGVGSSLREALAGQMQSSYFPVKLNELGATLHYHDLVEGTLEIGDIHVTTQYLNHPALTLGYRLEADGVTVVYATDHEPHSKPGAAGSHIPLIGQDERHARFLADADLVIHDAQYTTREFSAKRGWGHSTAEYAVEAAVSAGARRLALLQHELNGSDTAQLCRSLRSDSAAVDRDLPIVLVKIGENSAEQHVEAEAGVTDWLIWPFSEEYARARIRAWVLREACRWKNAPLPADEDLRLRALHESGLLDTEPEERFDRFTRIAAALFDVPIA